MEMDYGFIGLGNMGFHMAGNVRKKMESKGTLHVYDVDKETCTRFVAKFNDFGPINIATSAMAVARCSKTLILMIPMDEHARTVCLHKETGVIAAPRSTDRLIVDCSTISVSASKEIGRQLMEAGTGAYVDAPVSGGVSGAEQATLSFFCGYSNETQGKSTAKQLIETLALMGASERINLCGKLGAGLTAKLVNNYIALGNLAIAAQGMAFGIRHGLEAKVLYECVNGSTGDSLVWNAMQPVPGVVPRAASSNNFKPGFSLRLGLKDIGLAINAAEETGIDPSMGRVAKKIYEDAEHDARTSGLDCTSIWLHINDEVASFPIQ